MITSYKTALTEKEQLTNNIYLLTFQLIIPQEIDFVPGQYLILKVPKANAYVPRLYSIYSSNKIKNQIQFVVEIVPNGLASTYFLNMKINDPVEFQGPLGQFVLRENTNKKIFLATGSGIAPIISILESFQIVNYKLFWGLKTYEDVYLFNEFKKFSPTICLSREKNLDKVPQESQSFFTLGHVDGAMEEFSKNDDLTKNTDFYLCGRKEITESLRSFLLAKNIPPQNIFFEKF